MKVIIACEKSGIVRDAFLEKGHDAYSCDLLPCEKGRHDRHLIMEGDKHLQDTLYNRRKHKWDLMIGHPPCLRLCLSGSLRLYKDGKKINGIDPIKWEEMIRAAEFFKMMYNAPIKRKGLENPLQHGHAQRLIGVRHTQIIQPYLFGEDASKETCLWLVNLPLLTPPIYAISHDPNDIVGYAKPRIVDGKKRWSNQTDSGQNKLPPSKTRSADRARTYTGIANAMATQWNFK